MLESVRAVASVKVAESLPVLFNTALELVARVNVHPDALRVAQNSAPSES